jgi:hypothetical protein
MMQQYLRIKQDHPTPSSSTAWVTSTSCSSRTPRRPRG